jgi:SAM-dependent methyltransferase
MAVEPTPVRSLGTKGADGCVLLRDVSLAYRDGGEEEVLRLITETMDLSSASDELIRRADGWAQTYHLHPARANIVRCLELPESARVLEIGAGCGAITRYLGETCMLVDALEPVPVRAAATRARTRDLDNVEVFVGDLADVPVDAAYDVIVVIGVLEYVGEGNADCAPYREFLRGIRDRLVDGGTLVLAIENQLGVKYLAGSPEDHSGRVFDSLEGYPVGSPARTFSRRQLRELFLAAGLNPSFRIAFPDYKITRTVLGEFPAAVRSLLYRIPGFPSPDWSAPRPPLVDERSLWRSLVEAGLEFETGNSFLVLGAKGTPTSELWPADIAARFYSIGRRARLSAETVVRIDGDSVRFVREPLTDDKPLPDDRFAVVGSDHPYEAGQDLLSYVATNPDVDLPALLAGWQAKIHEGHVGDDAETLDIVPHNLILRADGALRVIDVELVGRVPNAQIVRRGLFWMAYHVARASPAGRWGDARTVRDVAVQLGEAAGLDAHGDWLEMALREELAVQLEVQNGPPLGLTDQEWAQQFEIDLRARLDERLADLPLGDRLPDRMRALGEHAEAQRRVTDDALQLHRAAIADLQGALAALREDFAEAEARYDELANSRAVRLANRCRRGLERSLPTGTRRRDLFRRATGGSS